MREMVLNHASLPPAGWRQTVNWLPEVADGMATLVRDGVAQATLRMCRSPHEIRYPDDRSLFDAYQELRQRGARDQYVFLMRLSTKVPLDDDLAPGVADRFQMCEATMCEARELPPDDGAPLVLCAVTAAIAVSVPSEPVWDRARIRVAFDELLPDEAFGEADEEIDNLARSAHAPPICERHRERHRVHCSNAADLWSRREQVFPRLAFGPDVEGHLAELNPGWFSTLVGRLADLDAAAAAWAVAGGDAPRWTVEPQRRFFLFGGFLARRGVRPGAPGHEADARSRSPAPRSARSGGTVRPASTAVGDAPGGSSRFIAGDALRWTADPQAGLIFLRFIQRSGVPRGFAAEYTRALYRALVN